MLAAAMRLAGGPVVESVTDDQSPATGAEPGSDRQQFADGGSSS